MVELLCSVVIRSGATAICVWGGGGVVTCCTHKGRLRDSLLKQEGQRSKLELSSSML